MADLDLSPWTPEQLVDGAAKARAAGRDDVAEYFEAEIQTRGAAEPMIDAPVPVEQQSRGMSGDLTGGLARGALQTLMIPADVLATGGNLMLGALNAATGTDVPYLTKPSSVVVPFAQQQLGVGTGSSKTPTGFAGEVLGGSVAPGMGAVGNTVRLGGSVARQGIREASAALGAGAGGAAATSIAPDSVAGQLAGTLIGGMTPAGIGAGMRLGSRDLLPVDQRQANLAAFERQGIQAPTAGMVSGPTSMETVTAKMPGGYGRAQETAAEIAEAMQQRVGAVASDTAGGLPLTAEQAGVTLQQGITRWADEFRETGGQMFNELTQRIRAEAPEVNMANTQDTLSELVPGGAFGDVVDNPAARRLLEQFGEGATPTIDDLQKLRTWVGNKMTGGQASEVATFDQGELRRLYGAISDDYREAAEAAGAQDLFTEANEFWSNGRQLLDRYLNPISAARGVTPEAAFRSVVRGTERGPTMPTQVLGAMNARERGHILGTVLDELGTARNYIRTDDTPFSNNSFLTRLNALQERGGLQAALELGTPRAVLAQDVTDLGRVSGRIREAERFGYNPSGSGQAINQAVIPSIGYATAANQAISGNLPGATAMAGATALMPLAMAGGQVLARNPRFVRWMADYEKLPPGQYQAHITRLGNIINDEQDQDAKRAMLDFQRKLEEQLR